MSGLIGKKIGMTSVYSAEGKNIPCTVIEAGPCVVTQIKTVENDSYEAVQIAYDDKSEKHTSKSLLGHFKKAGVTPKRKLVEFKGMPEVNLGDSLTVEMFSEEDWVDVNVSIKASSTNFTAPLGTIPTLVISSHKSLKSTVLVITFCATYFSALVLSKPNVLFLMTYLSAIVFCFLN